MTQSNLEVLAEQDFLCVERNTWLTQKIGLNGTTKIPGMELIECSLRFGWNLEGIHSLFHQCLMTAT